VTFHVGLYIIDPRDGIQQFIELNGRLPSKKYYGKLDLHFLCNLPILPSNPVYSFLSFVSYAKNVSNNFFYWVYTMS
jgi:hypothetical protein